MNWRFDDEGMERQGRSREQFPATPSFIAIPYRFDSQKLRSQNTEESFISNVLKGRQSFILILQPDSGGGTFIYVRRQYQTFILCENVALFCTMEVPGFTIMQTCRDHPGPNLSVPRAVFKFK